jgi:type II secretory ATPase GspE/PulE/Tfp pilus assembly ATPase PilB-like protein
VLVDWSNGFRKTTTLYSILHRINTQKVNIMTLEDPVEYQMPEESRRLMQAGLTFASGLAHFCVKIPTLSCG